MTIALSALVIALCSLIWNVVTTAHSWRANTPSIKLDLRTVWPRIEINVRNRGGSPTAVSSTRLIVSYKTRRRYRAPSRRPKRSRRPLHRWIDQTGLSKFLTLAAICWEYQDLSFHSLSSAIITKNGSSLKVTITRLLEGSDFNVSSSCGGGNCHKPRHWKRNYSENSCNNHHGF